MVAVESPRVFAPPADSGDDDFFEPAPPPAPVPKQHALSNLIRQVSEARGVVTNSMEFERIFALPRRVLELNEADAAAVTAVFRKPGGTMTLWPIQAACLVEAAQADGLFAMVGVGAGKTLVTLMLPEAMGAKRAVLLVPSRLKKKTEHEIEHVYGQHFNLPLDRLTIVTYEELSSAKKHDVLDKLDPDLLIADECHSVASRASARGKRLHRFTREHPACRYGFLSGTVTTRSVTDYMPLVELALRKNSPVPGHYREQRDWGGALDVKPQYLMMPGILKKFCEDKEEVRSGYRRRLVDTQGVVATSESAIGTSLIIRMLAPPVPPEVVRQLEYVRKNWSIAPDQDEYDSPLAMMRVLRQIALGFYLRWVWPDGVVDHDWLEARRAWHKEVRGVLRRSLRGMDSPLLCAQAAESGRWASETWAAWCAVKDRPAPPTEAVWRSDYAVRAACVWGREQDVPSIIWADNVCFGEAIASMLGLSYYGAGTDLTKVEEPLIVCSMRVHGTGCNLQHYSRNLLTSMPPNGKAVEQIIGRTHRPGQEADEVVVDWWGMTDETRDALAAVLEDAAYIEETTSQRQRVSYATKLIGAEV